MKTDNTQLYRRISQIVSFSLALGFLILVIAGANFVIHQACPYALVCFGLSGSSFLQLGNLAMSAAIIFGFGVLIYGMFFGRRFCAWLCPLGSLQEWIYNLRSRKYRIKHQTPFAVDQKLALLKYLVLFATVALSILGLGYVYIRLCPFFALAQIPKIAVWGLLVIFIIILKSWFGFREWCRFLCPYGALMNVFQYLGEKAGIRRKKVKWNPDICVNCGVCVLLCPMNINITESEIVHNRNCIHCELCAEHCPKQGNFSREHECPK